VETSRIERYPSSVEVQHRTVRMPRFMPPTFPEWCVECGAAGPGHRVSLSTGTLRHEETTAFWNWTPIFWLWSGRVLSVAVPVCLRCERGLLRRRRLRFVAGTVALVALFLAIIAGFYLIPAVGKRAFKLIAALVGGTVVLGWVLADLTLREPFDLIALRWTAVYTFRDEAFANEFAQLNQSARGAAERDAPRGP
jgi:fatty acid desaturase